MINNGIVKKIEGDKIEINLQKNSSCGSCKKCSEGKETTEGYIFTNKDLKLRVGDLISFEIDDSLILKIGMISYIFPIVVFFLGYFVTSFFTKVEGIRIIGSFVGFGISFFIISLLDKKIGKKVEEKIIIKEINDAKI